MSTSSAAPRSRLSADERREALVAAAVRHFGRTGLQGTAVSAITDEVGITQPYAFSLFGTKKGLFLAAVEHGFDRVEAAFRDAAAVAAPEERKPALGAAYDRLLADRDLLLLQLQGYAACGDPEVRDVVRARFRRLYELVRELLGEDAEGVRAFFAKGMLMNVAAAMEWPTLALDESWLEC
jgi:AcrR family transcriptional regulator